MSAECDITFRSMGSDVRLLIGPALDSALPSPAQAAAGERNFIEGFAARLSRFNPRSELTALNDDPRDEVPASALLRAAVGAALWAASRSGGLVDSTLLGALEAIGYERSLEDAVPASLTAALAAAPARRPAAPHPLASWRSIEVDEGAGLIRRPVGVKLDTGGIGKGLAADSVAHRLKGYARFAVDCGGDIAVGGPGAQARPYAIDVEHPLSGKTITTLEVRTGAIATSGLNVRVWRTRTGEYRHHLLDPATGLPAWTGLIGATALAPSALEAETLSKTALLLGADGARRTLARYGGVIVHDSGEFEVLEPARHGNLTLPKLRSAA